MGTVYLICDASNDLFKIGITKGDVKKRMANLQTGNGTDLHLVRTYESEIYKFIEKALHGKFVNKRVEGEWFKLDTQDIINFGEYCGICEQTGQALEDNPYITIY